MKYRKEEENRDKYKNRMAKIDTDTSSNESRPFKSRLVQLARFENGEQGGGEFGKFESDVYK